MAAVDAAVNAGATAETGLVWIEEAVMMEVVMSRPAADEVAAGEVATTEASSGLASQEDSREVAGEAVKEASASMRASEPPKTVVRASSGPRPALVGVKMERIISDRPTDRRLTEGKNGFGRIVAGYGHGYG
jgi:hypothetical protein